MADTILADSHSILKGDYPTAHESLCAKLKHAQILAEIAANADMTDSQIHGLMWCLADLLQVDPTNVKN